MFNYERSNPESPPQSRPESPAKSRPKSPKGERTRARILDVALEAFRARGFDGTTMRDIAADAGLSVGAAYHYFPNKEAIVVAYYEVVQREHASRAREELPGLEGADRVARALTLKLDVVSRDRALLGALLRYAGVPGHALSFVGAGTRDTRRRSVATFREALEPLGLPDALGRLAPPLLWALHMALLLHFVHDDSPDQRKSRRLAAGGARLVVRALRLLRAPAVRGLSRDVAALLEEVDLLPEA